MVTWEDIFKKGQWNPRGIDKSTVKFYKMINKKKLILDHGCGTGRNIIYLAKKGLFVIGMDNSSKALELSNLNLKKNKIKNACLVKGDMHKLPFPDKMFDGILSNRVIEHSTKKGMEKAVSEIYRVLKPKGIVCIVTKSIKDPKFGKGKRLEKRTYEESKGMVHHFIDKKEAKKLFSKFKILSLKEIKIKIKELKGKHYIYWEALLRRWK